MREKEIQTDILDLLLRHPKVAWATVTTTGTLQVHGRYITTGIPGMPDIIGQLKDGRLFGIEVKCKGRKPSHAQEEFIALINRYNGVAGVATSVEEALAVIEQQTKGG